MEKTAPTLRRLKLKSLVHFSRQAATSLKLGLPFSRAFPIIARESGDRRLRHTLTTVNENLAAGRTLTKAFRACGNRFPPIFLEMVDAGEESGHLESVFRQLTAYFNKLLKLRRAFIRASIYPAIQLTVAYFVFCLIMIIFSRDKQAMATIIGYATAAGIVGLGFGYLFFFRTSPGRSIWDRLILMIPFVRSVVIKLCMTRFTRTLALQLESSIPLAESFERAALATGNKAVTASFQRVADSISGGASLSEVAKELNHVTPLVREALSLAEEMGNFSEALESAADTYEEEAMLVMESIPKFIGPIVVIFVGIVVLYLFFTILTAIQSAKL